MLNQRVISALVAVPLLVFFIVMGGYVFKAGVLFLICKAVLEYSKAYEKTDSNVITPIIIIGALFNILIVSNDKTSYMFPLIILVTLCSMAAPIFLKRYNVLSSAVTITGYIYIAVFFSILILIRDIPGGNKYIWMVFIIAFCGDTMAYYTGRLFGKRKLCPDVSPKKTVEGFIGGIAGSIIGLMVWYIFIKDFSLPSLILLGAVGSIISVIGDLSASLIKRYVGIKDYGNIMPGHGGILDRFDSILFTAPVVYYYILMITG